MEEEANRGKQDSDEESIVFGSSCDFWRYSHKIGFDLTRSCRPGDFLRFDTTRAPITVDPGRSAVVIIDMQNVFIHPSLRMHETGLTASEQLLKYVIPASRNISLQIIWLNWGLTQQDVDEMPPSLKRSFACETIESNQRASARKIYVGLGESLGEIELSDGQRIDGGDLLMRDAWNTKLYDPLLESFNASQSTSKPDLLFHKNRISGLWSHESPLLNYLHSNQIVTLFFAGVNTDQCVAGTLQDALSKGFDCILLRDACGTNSPAFAQQCVEYNCAGWQGFTIEAEIFAKNANKSEKAKKC